MAQLTDRQILLLKDKLDVNRVGKDGKGFNHLQAWDVRRYLTRVFGFTGWGEEITDVTLISERAVPVAKSDDRFKYTVIYRVTTRLTVYDVDGAFLTSFSGTAVGDAINQNALGDAHDLALKTAASQALKRAAHNLGDQFGLSMYNGGDTRPVVNWSVAYPKPGPITADEPVKGDPTEADAELDRRIDQAVSEPVQDRSEPSGPVSPGKEAQDRVNGLAVQSGTGQPEAVNGDSSPTVAELEYAVAYGPDDVSSAALAALDQLAVNAKVVAYNEMRATAVRVGFFEQLPGQFVSSFGIDIMSGTTEQYREATRIMNGGQP